MKTVFIIESDAVLLRAYASSLAMDDRQIVVFRTAQLAAKALNKCIPDLIVLELALPGHNGFELLYELRSYADTRDTKIIIYSLLVESDVNLQFVTKESLGITAYLQKQSTSLEDLRRAVSEALK